MTSRTAFQRAPNACMDCFGVDANDRVLIVSNPPQRRVAKALFDAARERADGVRHMEYATLARHGEEPPDAVAHALREATVALAPTVYSISHTRARIEATARGVRIAGMSSLTEAAFASALPIDYGLLERSTAVVGRALTAARTCRLTSRAGRSHATNLRAHGTRGQWESSRAWLIWQSAGGRGVHRSDRNRGHRDHSGRRLAGGVRTAPAAASPARAQRSPHRRHR